MRLPAFKTALFVLCLGFALPFILFQDLYPFYRFGMFAEPVKRGQAYVGFETHIRLPNASWQVFNGQSFGFTDSNWQQLMRNYHYRSQDTLFIQKLSKCHWPIAPQGFKLYKITFQEGQVTDTLLLYAVSTKGY